MSTPTPLDAVAHDEPLRASMQRLASGDDPEAARMLERLATRLFDASPRVERVARFELRERLGAGAMGVVYAAWDPQLDRRVAIKLLRRDVGRSHDPDAEQRLLREAKAMAQLRHPNVIPVYEVGRHEGQIFVAMQIIEGASLREWLRERPRGWSELLDVFLAAGRGLAAAHAAGLVHRDFKPDNVLIEEGRVFVGDFGLARRHASDAERLADTRGDAALELDASATLTRSGTRVGTPAYMAPEAREGTSVDARADQWSFCASLFEALHGRRPTAGALEPAAARVPAWLDRIVRRGLAADPLRRHATMDALLLALERGRRRRRARLVTLAGAGAVLLALASGVALSQLGAAPSSGDASLCDPAESRLGEVWSRERSARIAAAFEASALPYATDLAAPLVAALDAYASDWQAGYRDACEATHLRHTQSSHALDLRMRCLERRVADLDALLERFESPTDEDVANALHAVLVLAPISSCAALEQLESSTPLPDDPEARAVVERVRAELGRVSAAIATNQHAEVEALAAALVEQADASGYRPLAAEARFAYGMVLARVGKPREADVALEQAIVDAQASGHDEVAGRALVAEVHVVGYQLRDHEGGRRYLRQAEALLEHLGAPPRALASLARNAGTVEFAAGDLEAARVRFDEAIERFAALDGPDHFTVAETRSNLAAVERKLGRPERALALQLEAGRALARSLGPLHPSMLNLLNNTAASYIALGRLEEAEATLEQALALAERSLRHDHATLGHPLNNLGEVLLARGQPRAARARYGEAIAVWEGSLGPEHPLLAHPLSGRGAAAIALGEFEAARVDLERALVLRSAPGSSPVERGETEFLLVLAREGLGVGEPAERRALAELALADLGEADGDLIPRARVVEWLAAGGSTR